MTQETKWTPGIWGTSRRNEVTAVHGGAGEWIALLPHGHRDGYGVTSDEEIAANSALIAAAPEMAEALRAIIGAQTDLLHVGYDDAPGGGNYVYADVIRTDNPAFDLARAVLQKAGG